jgi:hypothetical protein
MPDLGTGTSRGPSRGEVRTRHATAGNAAAGNAAAGNATRSDEAQHGK